MDLFTKDLKQLTADFINGAIGAGDIPPKQVIGVQRRLWAMKHWGKMKELSEACIERLNRKGQVYLEGHGWVKATMVPYMGLVKKNERWVIGDVDKFRSFLKTP